MSAAQILKSMKAAPVLDNRTYNRWSAHFKDALSLFDLEDFILESKVQLATGNDKTASKSDINIHKKDKNIRIAISQLVPDFAFHLVDSSYTSKQCWDNLEQFYRPNSSQDVDDLLQEFWSIGFEDDVDVDELVQKLAGLITT